MTAGSTIFSSGSNLNIIPFTTSFCLLPMFVTSTSTLCDTCNMDYTLSAYMSGNNAIINLLAMARTQISQFHGLAILINPNTMNTVKSANSWNMSFSLQIFSFTSPFVPYNLSMQNPTYGPNFKGKCIFGIYRMKYQGSSQFDCYFTNTSSQNY